MLRQDYTIYQITSNFSRNITWNHFVFDVFFLLMFLIGWYLWNIKYEWRGFQSYIWQMIHFLLKYTLHPNLGSYNINMSVYDTIISIQAIDNIAYYGFSFSLCHNQTFVLPMLLIKLVNVTEWIDSIFYFIKGSSSAIIYWETLVPHNWLRFYHTR